MTRDRGTHTIIHTHAKTNIAKLDASGAVYPALLDASSHLYTRVCPSVRPSVRRTVRPSHVFLNKQNWMFASQIMTKTPNNRPNE